MQTRKFKCTARDVRNVVHKSIHFVKAGDTVRIIEPDDYEVRNFIKNAVHDAEEVDLTEDEETGDLILFPAQKNDKTSKKAS